MGIKNIITTPFKWGKNQAKTFTDWDMNFGKGGTVSDVARDLNVKKGFSRKYKNETFAEASERLKMTEADQKDAFDYYKNLFRLWFGLGILATLVILTVVVHKNYASCLPALAFVVVAFAQCYKASYHCYCINHRSLAGLDKWKQSKEWFPRPFVFKDKAQMILSQNRSGQKSIRKISSSSAIKNKNRLEGKN